MRIGFICDEYPPGPHGGIGTFTQTLARALVEHGHSVRVLGSYPAGHPSPGYEEDHGVQVWRTTKHRARGGWILDRLSLYRTVSQWIRERHVEMIEVPDYGAGAAGWPRLPVPVIGRLCGSISYFSAEMNAPLRRPAFWLERASLRRADYLCSMSGYTAERSRELFRLGARPIQVLYNAVAVPASDESRPPRSRHDVVFTGTLTAKKGVMSLIRAWPAVRGACPDATLHLLGRDGRGPNGGSMRAHLESELGDAGRRNVHFYDHVDRANLLDRLARARVGVFPSYSETFGIAPVEAMGQGCPTIYSSRSCGPEVVRDEQDGLLVDPDHPEQIAAAVIRVLTDDALAARLSEAGRSRVLERYAVPRITGENEDFYRGCLRDFAARRENAAMVTSAGQ